MPHDAKKKIHSILNSAEDSKAEKLKKEQEANKVTPSPDSAYTHRMQRRFYGSVFTGYRGEPPGAHVYMPGFSEEEVEEIDRSRMDRMQFGGKYKEESQ
jgi:hypothetical protein